MSSSLSQANILKNLSLHFWEVLSQLRSPQCRWEIAGAEPFSLCVPQGNWDTKGFVWMVNGAQPIVFNSCKIFSTRASGILENKLKNMHIHYFLTPEFIISEWNTSSWKISDYLSKCKEENIFEIIWKPKTFLFTTVLVQTFSF